MFSITGKQGEKKGKPWECSKVYAHSKDDLIQSLTIQMVQAAYGFGDDSDCIKNKLDSNNPTMRHIAYMRYVYTSKLDLFYSLK